MFTLFIVCGSASPPCLPLIAMYQLQYRANTEAWFGVYRRYRNQNVVVICVYETLLQMHDSLLRFFSLIIDHITVLTIKHYTIQCPQQQLKVNNVTFPQRFQTNLIWQVANAVIKICIYIDERMIIFVSGLIVTRERISHQLAGRSSTI